MNIITLALLTGWQLLLFKVIVAVVVFWGITELIKWLQWPIPRPIVILAICLFIILVCYWLFEIFNVLI